MEHVLSLTAIRDQKATLSRVIADAQSQLADLDVAERIVRRFGQATEAPRPSDDEIDDLLGPIAPKPCVASVPARSMTAKMMMIAVLRQSPSPWMTSDELRERVIAIKGDDVPMGTVGPTLSNMKNEGVIVRDGFKVALAERLNANGLGSPSADDRDEGASTPSHPPFASNPPD